MEDTTVSNGRQNTIEDVRKIFFDFDISEQPLYSKPERAYSGRIWIDPSAPTISIVKPANTELIVDPEMFSGQILKEQALSSDRSMDAVGPKTLVQPENTSKDIQVPLEGKPRLSKDYVGPEKLDLREIHGSPSSSKQDIEVPLEKKPRLFEDYVGPENFDLRKGFDYVILESSLPKKGLNFGPATTIYTLKAIKYMDHFVEKVIKIKALEGENYELVRSLRLVQHYANCCMLTFITFEAKRSGANVTCRAQLKWAPGISRLECFYTSKDLTEEDKMFASKLFILNLKQVQTIFGSPNPPTISRNEMRNIIEKYGSDSLTGDPSHPYIYGIYVGDATIPDEKRWWLSDT